MESKAPVDLQTINRYLGHFSLSITQEEFDILLTIRKVEFELPLNKSSELLLDSIGRNLSKSHKDSENNRFAGVYIFTNKLTGEEYVGSSINLGSRVRYYFKASIRNTENRLIIQSLNDYGIENFTLAIYKIDPKLFEIEFKPLEYSRALEQYYIFNSNSVLNSIKVAGASPAGPMDENTKLSIGKANSKPLYNHDKSILHYTAVSTVSFLQKVQTSQSTLRNYLASGKALVGKFVFSREFYPGVEIQLMDSTDLSELIAEGKTEQNLVRLTNPETKKKNVRL